MRDARAAADATYRRLIFEPGERRAAPGRLGIALGGLLLLFIVPGLLAAPWFRLSGLATRLGMVPVVSLLLNLTSTIVLLAILRRPLSPGVALLAVGLASLGALALRLRSARLAPAGDDRTGEEQRQGHG